ncbi:hypothetical protein F5Y07DRAFT_157417 [Xylaria sp. FL0933]|nr:hypothetical protein F5Y07DRAFT_157417 [Xylaria sp. FL0933]
MRWPSFTCIKSSLQKGPVLTAQAPSSRPRCQKGWRAGERRALVRAATAYPGLRSANHVPRCIICLFSHARLKKTNRARSVNTSPDSAQRHAPSRLKINREKQGLARNGRGQHLLFRNDLCGRSAEGSFPLLTAQLTAKYAVTSFGPIGNFLPSQMREYILGYTTYLGTCLPTLRYTAPTSSYIVQMCYLPCLDHPFSSTCPIAEKEEAWSTCSTVCG